MTDETKGFVPIEALALELKKLGLAEQKVNDGVIYTLDLADTSVTSETISDIRELVEGRKIAVEIGPTRDLGSLTFAAEKSGAEIVIGIDPFFDFSQLETVKSLSKGLTILIKGDAWGNEHLRHLFGTDLSREHRLAGYAQLVSPDSDITEAMMSATISKSNKKYLVVLDSGAVELLTNRRILPTDIRKQLLEEAGYENPAELDWLRHIYRRGKITEIDSKDYEKGVDQGEYPPTSFLRNGTMLVLENND